VTYRGGSKPRAQLPGYRGIHNWIARNFAKTGRCEYCGSTDRRTEWASASHQRYTRNRADWFEFCRRCHDHYDGRTPPNTKGRTMTAEHKQKLSAALKGRNFPHLRQPRRRSA
jgi:hypothetical protein